MLDKVILSDFLNTELSGDKEVFIAIFLALKKQLKDFESFVNSGAKSLDELERFAHKLRPLCLQLGAIELSQRYDWLEKRCKIGAPSDALNSEVIQLLKKNEVLVRVIQEFIEETP